MILFWNQPIRDDVICFLDCNKTIQASHCGDDEKKCHSGECIPSLWWCDGAHDCVDMSDETSCQTVTCDPNFIKCNDVSYQQTFRKFLSVTFQRHTVFI